MRRLFVLPIATFCATLAVAACHEAPEENVEAKAEKTSRALVERHNQLVAEAENSVDAAAAPYDNQADALLTQMAGNAAAPANGAARK